MSFAPFYILYKAVYIVLSFFKHWYVDGFSWFFNHALSAIGALDRTLALKITLRNFFKPLYGDYTILGRILGFPFRTMRVVAGGFVYFFVVVFFIVLYLAWALLPPILMIGTALGEVPSVRF